MIDAPACRLAIQPMTPEAFAPFGTLLEAPVGGLRQDGAARLENTRPGVPANLALVRSLPFAETMPLRALERHPHSSQTFLPLGGGDYLVVVAPDRDGRPDPDALLALRVPGHLGVHYRAGAWHAHMTTIAAPKAFAMLVHEDGSAEDCIVVPIDPVVLVLPD
ncbi:ureidoglycolate lyase [Methylobacterium iners]|uniref:Ureidoglycolate lyase n=1 Tax=Methylobacterium iners TaxID=418707 RepID=A0ABQ4S611_9HYPH|nr:ureidoglycolate lyase [Methylobacterium iners]GJD97562.1 Ureidoglycolate lyase [Methylobacterium iners]